MPNFDGGHYFLTALAPIRMDARQTDGVLEMPINALRAELSCLPTAQQSRISAASGLNSPFARNRRTHFARFVVIDDAVFNGRDPDNALAAAVTQESPLVARGVDRLNAPYLLFSADFDAASGDEHALDSYLDELFATMREELEAIFRHCIGFETGKDAAFFRAYVKRCQVETTMPFNDYWIAKPPLRSLAILPLLAPPALAILVAAAAGVAWLVGLRSWPSGWIAVGAAVAAAVTAFLAYRLVLRRGRHPFPAAPDSDLKSILKALFLQQHFLDFAVDAQGMDAGALHDAFGRFLATCQPLTLDEPTQQPGTIRS